jgi:hypothetical protein
MKVKEFVDKLCEGLGINQKHLASLLDVTSEALTRAKDETFSPNTATKVIRRLDALTFAVYPLLQEPISPVARLSAVKALAYEDINGNFDSVISALKQDKYQKELLQIIAKNAFDKIREKNKTEDKFLNEYAHILAEASI